MLGWALCPPEGRGRRVETGQHERKAELTSDGKHPCQHEPKTDSSPLTKTVEPSLFINCFCLVGRLLSHAASEDGHLRFAKRKAFLLISKYEQQQ